jgi:SNF2 family DNA or RNA helicase
MGLEIIKDEISNAKFDLIVVDEANAYKNVQTKRWKILASVIRPETWVWMLTGTPASQSPTDAYGLAKLINPYRRA